MSSIQQVSFDASKSQTLQLKSRYEYFSHGLTTLNRLQTIAPNRPVIATALKVMFAVPALIADVVRNLAAALANLALSLANLGVALQNMAHKLLHGRHVQPMPHPVVREAVAQPEESKSEFVLTEQSFEKSASVASMAANIEEEIIFGKSETLSTSSSSTLSSSSTIDSEEEFTEEAQSEAQSSQWVTASRVIGASVAIAVSCGAYAYREELGLNAAGAFIADKFSDLKQYLGV